MTRLPRLFLAAAGLALGVTGCGSGQTTATLEDYRPGPGARQVTVNYTIGRADKPGKAEVVRQNPTEVVIRVVYQHDDDINVMLGVIQEATLDLNEPLGNRKVLNHDGTQIPLHPEPTPQLIGPGT